MNPGNTEASKNSVSLEVIRYFLKKSSLFRRAAKKFEIFEPKIKAGTQPYMK